MLSGTSTEGDHIVEVSANTVDRRIIRVDVCREVNRTLREEVWECLQEDSQGEEGDGGAIEVPTWVIEHVREFVEGMMPFVESRGPNRTGGANEG
jgi:hypothetical protein